jgi:hypothetical protein
MRARLGRTIRHTLDVFILCSKIIMENRWEKSPVVLVSHCDKHHTSSLDTSANSAGTRDTLTQYPEEIHRDGVGCVASLWVAMVASAMVKAVKVCAAADVCREMTRLDGAAQGGGLRAYPCMPSFPLPTQNVTPAMLAVANSRALPVSMKSDNVAYPR